MVDKINTVEITDDIPEAGDVLEENLHGQVQMCARAGMDPMEVIIRGLGYFMKMNYFCAPDQQTADKLIDDMKLFYRDHKTEVKLDG